MVVNRLRRPPERVGLRDVSRAQPPAPPELTLVEELERHAQTEGLSQRALMRACGLDKTIWIRVRQGEYRFGPETCAKIVSAYPSMRGAAVRYLVDSFGPPALQLLADASRLATARQGGPRRRACR